MEIEQKKLIIFKYTKQNKNEKESCIFFLNMMQIRRADKL